MGIDERDIRRATEDVHAVPVGERPGYAWSTSGAVRHREVAMEGGGLVLGYLWYSDDEHAAGYVARAAAGDDAFNAGAYWYDSLTSARQRGLRPSQAVAEFEGTGVGGEPAGWIVPESEAESPSVQELRISAGLSPSGPVPARRRREPGDRGPRQR